MSFRKSALAVATLALVLTGCVAGNTHTFNYMPAERTEIGHGRVVLLIAVDDQRPYILDKDEPANFVGEQRNGYGMPFNVTTTDKRPFANVVQETVQRDLEAVGFRVTPSTNKGGTDVPASLAQASATRALMIVMREFKSDTFNNINVDYDFEAVVFGSDGKELARNKVSGEDELKGSLMNPVKAARQKVPEYFYGRIHALIAGDPNIMKALTSD
jgi:hypothetical protein